MKINLIILLGAVFFTACTKYDVKTPDDFLVTVSKTEFATTDTVKFDFAGNPDFISFYSGEPGKNYAFANTRQLNPDSVQLVFSSTTTASSATTQPVTANRVSLLVSTDFSGVMDSAGIRAATWRNISDSAKWATGTATLTSGTLQVDQYRKAGSPVYFAFRYTSDNVRADYLARRWVINSFVLRSYAKGVFNPLTAGTNGTSVPFTTGGFQNKSLLDNTNNWVFGNTSLTFNAPGVGALPNEDWSISRAFDFTGYVPDVAVGIKVPTTKVPAYQYRFTRPGIYTVTFVAKNQSSAKSSEIVRQITLTIK